MCLVVVFYFIIFVFFRKKDAWKEWTWKVPLDHFVFHSKFPPSLRLAVGGIDPQTHAVRQRLHCLRKHGVCQSKMLQEICAGVLLGEIDGPGM